MNKKFIFLVLLIVSFSCGTNNKPIPDAEKNNIKVEIKEIVDKMFKGNEEVNLDIVTEPFLDSPDFVFLIHGHSLSYKELVAGIKPIFKALLNQKVTIVDEKYVIIDKLTVLYTTNCKLLENFKDGHSSLNDPATILYVFRKIDSKWKIIYGAETYTKVIN
jgi:hypothetical protein